MPRSASYDGAFDKMPLSVQRAAAVPRDYYDQALCRHGRSEVPSMAWTVEPGRRKHRVGGVVYDADTLVQLALTTCRICPVQWECAIAAIEAEECAGIWADTLENLRMVRRSTHVIKQARVRGTPVQVAVRAAIRGIS